MNSPDKGRLLRDRSSSNENACVRTLSHKLYGANLISSTSFSSPSSSLPKLIELLISKHNFVMIKHENSNCETHHPSVPFARCHSRLAAGIESIGFDLDGVLTRMILLWDDHC